MAGGVLSFHQSVATWIYIYSVGQDSFQTSTESGLSDLIIIWPQRVLIVFTPEVIKSKRDLITIPHIIWEVIHSSVNFLLNGLLKTLSTVIISNQGNKVDY